MDDDSLRHIRWTRSPVPLVEAEDRTSHSYFIVKNIWTVPGADFFAVSPDLNEANTVFGVVPDGVDHPIRPLVLLDRTLP